MRVVAIIQARMGSTRLPGKILKKVLNKTLLEYQIERVQRAKTVDQIIIATTIKESDNEIVELCQMLDIPVYRGSEDDVLSRYYEAAKKYNADVIVRLTSDCPLIDPKEIDNVVLSFLNHQPYVDYASNTIKRTFPRGLDTEVFSFETLQQTFEEAELPSHREHVTAFIYNNPKRFSLLSIHGNTDYSQHRWTVDTFEDFQLIEKVITHLYKDKPNFVYKDVLELLDKNPDWFLINHHIEQKRV